MIAHVAEAGEDSGRVVLHLGAELSPVALEAAFLLARSFRSEVEGLCTENRNLLDLAAFPFAREISVSGAIKGPFDTAMLERRQHRATAARLRHARSAADKAGVRLTTSIRTDEPTRALATACAERGPWNMVTLGEPVGHRDMPRLTELFATVWGTTGIVVSGPQAHRISGPVVAVVESVERFSPLLRTAETLAAAASSTAEIILVGRDADLVAEMEHQARLILGDENHPGLPIAAVGDGGAAAIAQLLRAMGAGFVIAQFDGIAVPAEGDHSLLSEPLDGPLLLVR